MTARDDLDRQLDALLRDGPTELPEPSFYAVRDRTEYTRQRVVIGPWRMPYTMNKFVTIGLGAGAVVVALVIGTQLLGPPTSGVGGSPSPSPDPSPTAASSPSPVGGSVKFRVGGAATTTDVDAVADGTSVSGTAVTTYTSGTHTVELECAARDGDTWAFGGTVEQTTVPGGLAGDWSAVVVRDGPPQQIGIWLGDAKSEGIDCDGWLASIDLAGIPISELSPVESGALVPPPDLAP